MPAAATDDNAAAAARRRASPDDKSTSTRGLSDGLRKVIRLQLGMISAHPSAAAAAAAAAAAPATAPPALWTIKHQLHIWRVADFLRSSLYSMLTNRSTTDRRKWGLDIVPRQCGSVA